jgi:hypothetical protein
MVNFRNLTMRSKVRRPTFRTTRPVPGVRVLHIMALGIVEAADEKASTAPVPSDADHLHEAADAAGLPLHLFSIGNLCVCELRPDIDF